MFPIYQTTGDEASYFSYEQGESDAQAAYDAARSYGFKRGTTIYFAVDFDALGYHITNNIIPYFQGVNELMNFYKVGVYGPRNVGITVSENGLATTSFVAGLSTGFSGNLGYPLPDNWAFDQISTISIGSGEGYISIDNNIKSGRDNGSSSFVEDNPNPVDDSLDQLGRISLVGMQYTRAFISDEDELIPKSNLLVTQYYRKDRYSGGFWELVSGPITDDFVTYANENPNINDEFIDLIDPVTGLTVGIEHTMATLSAELYNDIPIITDRVTDFAGWTGDLVTVIKDVHEHQDEYDGDWYECAKDYIGTSTKESFFSFDDLAGDVDAMNIGKNLREKTDSTIYNEFVSYYHSNQVHNRFSTFFELRFNSDEKLLYEQAEMYLIGSTPDIAGMREILVNSYEVPDFTNDRGKQVARAFTDVILEIDKYFLEGFE
ncbi:protein of unknown function [Salimicrobium salexigens]|uniref:Rv2525c-like glycoside hydrolase-like domain-containing protein n=1 Tax=Salimicrobium salexigens TaxID=908941 RepID=A0ABY1KPW6_9BACI|nr:protein of unknown function [Salimicrobium salexigens]